MPVATRNKNSELPLYRRIELDLRSRIQNQEWSPSEMMPSRRDMAIQYGVDVNTFQRAISALLEDGLLRADAGRGTFVTQFANSIGGDNNRARLVASRDHRLPSAPKHRSLQGVTAGLLAGFPPEDEWLPKIINSFEMAFSAKGGQTRFFNRLIPDIPAPIDPWISMEDAIDSLLDTSIDVLVLFSIYDRPNELERAQKKLATSNCELIYVSWDNITQPVHHVFYDNKIAGYQAAQHLIENGHKRITFFSPIESRWVDDRLEFARRAASDAGLTAAAVQRYPTDHLVHDYTGHVALGYESAKRGFAEGIFEDAILCANDCLAVGLLKAASEIGKLPCDDFSVIGFDNAPMARILGLSTMRPPLESLGSEAARLAELIISGETSPVQVRLSSHLVLRSSTSVRQKAL